MATVKRGRPKPNLDHAKEVISQWLVTNTYPERRKTVVLSVAADDLMDALQKAGWKLIPIPTGRKQ